MKLEVGMYVRTLNGIAKVIKKRKNPYGKETIFILDKPYMYHFTDFLKTAEDLVDINFEEDTSQIKGASNNIIDLIEVGDYVNGLLVVDKYYDYANKEWRLNDRDGLICSEKDIETILTKEQFSQMQYKVD